MTRAFVCVKINDEAIREVERINKEIQGSRLINAKHTLPENLHLTLKFLGEISEDKIEEVKKNLEKLKVKKFNASFSDIGTFSETFLRIVWLKVTGKEIVELQKDVDEALSDLFGKENRFMSHLTIARIRGVKDRDKFLEFLKTIKVNPVSFLIDKIYLKKSTLTPKGPVYEILFEKKLL